MTDREFEKRLIRHAAYMKENLAAPSRKETEEKLIMYEHNANNIRKGKKLKVAVIALVAALLLGTTAFAAGAYPGGWFSGAVKQYESIPDEQQLETELSFSPVCIERFENGFVFVRGSVNDNIITDTEMGPVDSFKSAMFEYEREGEMLIFSQDKLSSPPVMSGEAISEYKGIGLYYGSFANIVVPEDYVLTEADREAQENGAVFSYGSDEIMRMEVTSLSWIKDGVSYLLMQTDGSLSPDDFVQMAEEIIG